MSMFQEGGVALEDEGGEIEETSGNEVPLGGVKEGVADDQPAQLSPGEMVLSEDVVRYHGVEKIMALRDEAKIGYKKMEAMGQLGNADEATIPTEAIFNPGGMPFSVVDLEYIEMDENENEDEVMAMADNEDEPIEAQTGTLVPVQQPAASFSRINPATGLPEISTAPAASVPQVLQPGTPAPITTGSTLTPTTLSTLTPTGTPISAPDRPVAQQPAPLTQLPPIGQFLGGTQGTNFFINEIGQVIQIPVVNGRQIFEEPEGFQPHDPTNPQPYDPDLEDDSTVTTPDEQPQRRRTVTQRDLEGGQPDVGPGGFDTPAGETVPGVTTSPSQTGLGFGTLNDLSALHDQYERQDISLTQLAEKLGTTKEKAAERHKQNRFARKFLPLALQIALGLRGSDDQPSEYGDMFGDPDLDNPDMGLGLDAPTSSGQTGYEGDEAVGGFTSQSDVDTGADNPGMSGTGVDAPGASDNPGMEGQLNTGGLVPKPKSKKKEKKNNRKGLASKKKY